MKVVHISTHIAGGAGIAAYRLHLALLEKNIDSSFLCVDDVSGRNMVAAAQFLSPRYPLPARIIKKITRLFRRFFPKPQETQELLLTTAVSDLQKSLPAFVSLPFSPNNILSHPLVKAADIIHFHWVTGMVDYPSFFSGNTKPVAWTLHDMNVIKGIFHYGNDEAGSGQIAVNLDDRVRQLKQALINRRSFPLQFITPSVWLKEEVEKLALYKDVDTKKIANPLDMSEFYPVDKSVLRTKFNIPAHNTVLLFVAQSVQDERKGFDLLLAALHQLKDNHITIFVIGNAPGLELPAFDLRLLGTIQDSDQLRTYYSLADAFVIPSREDNLPNVMVEAMACGTPVLSFDVGGMRETIRSKFNGLKAADTNATALSDTIQAFIATKDQYSNDLIREFAVNNFSKEMLVTEFEHLYNRLLKDQHN